MSQKKIAFVTAPKVACTSIKMMFFELENGFQFQNFYANGTLRHIHDYAVYPAVPFASLNKEQLANCLKLTMVRDPVRRFLSAYSNRVGYYKELSRRHIADSGLPFDPDIHTFVRLLHEYRQVSRSIWLHTSPLCHFIGENPHYYDRIFDISEFDALQAVISAHIGVDVRMPHEQTGGVKLNPSELTDAEVKKITDFYRVDYECYSNYFKLGRPRAV